MSNNVIKRFLSFKGSKSVKNFKSFRTEQLTGSQGESGTQGLSGERGPSGPTGNTGPAGAIGAKGGVGLPGDHGATGHTGASGAIGLKGPQGETGPMPKHETRGDAIRFEIAPGLWGKWMKTSDQGQRTAIAGSIPKPNTLEVLDEGISLPTDAKTLDFVGDGVVASGSGSNKTITIPGGGGAANPQKAFYEGMSTRSLIESDFNEPPTSKIANGIRGIVAGAGAAITGQLFVSAIDHTGIWSLVTGTTASGRCFIISENGFGGSGIVLGSNLTRIGTWIHTGTTLSTAIERYVLRSGLFSVNLPNLINAGIGFEYQDDQNGGRWQAVTEDGVAETSVDTGVTVSINTWYKLEVEITADGSSAEFFIDNVSVATITTNIPTGVPQQVFYNTHIMKLLGTTSRILHIDAYYIYQEINR